MILGEQFGAAGLAAMVRGPCRLQTGTTPTVRTPPYSTQTRPAHHGQTLLGTPTDRPHPPQTGSAHQGHFPASTSDRTFPCLGHTPDSAFSSSWGLGSFGDPFCVFVSCPCVCLCVTLSLLWLSVSSIGSPTALPAVPSLQLWDRNSLLGPCLSPGHRTVPPEVAEQTKQGHFGTVLELCPPPNKHSEMSAAPKRNGQLPLHAVLCVARGTSKPHNPPAPSEVSLVGPSFKSVLRLVFQLEVVASLSVPLSGACCPARAGQENVV